MTDALVQSIWPKAADAERRLSLSPCPSTELAFSSSLSQILLEWSVLDQDKLCRFVEEFPRTCCVTMLRQEPKSGAAIFRALCESGGVLACRGLLCRCCCPSAQIQAAVLSQIIGECFGYALSAAESQSSCRLVMQSMVCALTRNLSLEEEKTGENARIFSVLQAATKLASERVRKEGSPEEVPLILEPVYRIVVLEYLQWICKATKEGTDVDRLHVPASNVLARYLESSGEPAAGAVSFEDIAALSDAVNNIVQVFDEMPRTTRNTSSLTLWVLAKHEDKIPSSQSARSDKKKNNSTLPWWVQLLHPRLSQAKRRRAEMVQLADVLCPSDVHEVLTQATVFSAQDVGIIPPWQRCRSLCDAEAAQGGAAKPQNRGTQESGTEREERLARGRICLLLSLHASVRSALEWNIEERVARSPLLDIEERVYCPGEHDLWLLNELRSRTQVKRMLTVWEDVVRDAGKRNGPLDRVVWWTGLHCLLSIGSLSRKRHENRNEPDTDGAGNKKRQRELACAEEAEVRGQWHCLGVAGLVKEAAVTRVREEVGRRQHQQPSDQPTTRRGDVPTHQGMDWEWIVAMGAIVLAQIGQATGEYFHCLQTYLFEVSRAARRLGMSVPWEKVKSDQLARAIAQCPLYLGAVVASFPGRRRDAILHEVLQSLQEQPPEVAGATASKGGTHQHTARIGLKNNQVHRDSARMGLNNRDRACASTATAADSKAQGQTWYQMVRSGGRRAQQYFWVEAMVKELAICSGTKRIAGRVSGDEENAADGSGAGAEERLAGLEEWGWSSLLLQSEEALDVLLLLSEESIADETGERSAGTCAERLERSAYVLDAIRGWCAIVKEEQRRQVEQGLSSHRRFEHMNPDRSDVENARGMGHTSFELLVRACDVLVLRRSKLGKLLPHLLPAIDELCTTLQLCSWQTTAFSARSHERDTTDREVAHKPSSLVRYLMAGPACAKKRLAELSRDDRDAVSHQSVLCKALRGSVEEARTAVLGYFQIDNPRAATYDWKHVLGDSLEVRAVEDDITDTSTSLRKRPRTDGDSARWKDWAMLLTSVSSRKLSLQNTTALIEVLLDEQDIVLSQIRDQVWLDPLLQVERTDEQATPQLWLTLLQGMSGHGVNHGIGRRPRAMGLGGVPERSDERSGRLWRRGVGIFLSVLWKVPEDGLLRLMQRLILGVRAGKWQAGSYTQSLVSVLLNDGDSSPRQAVSGGDEETGTQGSRTATAEEWGHANVNQVLSEWLVGFPYCALRLALSAEDGSDREQGTGRMRGCSCFGPGSAVRAWWAAGEQSADLGGWQRCWAVLQRLESAGLWTEELRWRILDLVVPPHEQEDSMVRVQAENLEAMACFDSRGFLGELRKRAEASPCERAINVCRWTGGQRSVQQRGLKDVLSELEAGAWIRAVEQGVQDRGLVKGRKRGASSTIEDGLQCGTTWADKGWCLGYSGGLGALLSSADEGARRRAAEIVVRSVMGRQEGRKKMQVLIAQECAELVGRIQYAEQCESLVALVRHVRWGAKGRVYATAASARWEEWLEGVAERTVEALETAVLGEPEQYSGQWQSSRSGSDIEWGKACWTLTLLKELLGHAGAVDRAAGRRVVKPLVATMIGAASDGEEGLGGRGPSGGERMAAGVGAVECLVELGRAGGEGNGQAVQIEAREALGGLGLASVAAAGSDALWQAVECGLLVLADPIWMGGEGPAGGLRERVMGGSLVERVRSALDRCGEEEVRTFCRLSRLLLRLEA